jgi:hypothetical protein
LGAAEFLAKFCSLANLFEQSELFAIFIWPGTKEPQRGRARAEMVLGPFAPQQWLRPSGRAKQTLGCRAETRHLNY